MKVVMLAGKGSSTHFIFNGVNLEHTITKVILEEPSDKLILIKRRIKRLGYLTVFNQLLFQIFLAKIIKKINSKYLVELKNTLQLNESEIPKRLIEEVSSVNSDKCRSLLKQINPDIVLVNGTRIIGKKTLASTNAIIINSHVGITPEYRGVHGGYWAMANDDVENCGVTVHTVDAGIDTGAIIGQDRITVSSRDSYASYPLKQYAKAIPLVINAIGDIANGNLRTYTKENASSKLFYHPTFTGYLYKRIFDGVK